MINPTDEDLYRFSSLLNREKFWLENEQEPSVKYWCYKVDDFKIIKDDFGAWTVDVKFTCHPTKYFKGSDTQRLTRSGTLTVQGSALAFLKSQSLVRALLRLHLQSLVRSLGLKTLRIACDG